MEIRDWRLGIGPVELAGYLVVLGPVLAAVLGMDMWWLVGSVGYWVVILGLTRLERTRDVVD